MAEKAATWKICLSDIDFGPEEERAVLEILRSKWLTLGARTAEFEGRFAEQVGASHAVAVSSCTAALHLSLMAAGVGPGDEVIVPSLTFVATVNAVLYCGGTPVFADITGPDELVIDPSDVQKKITSKTKVLLPMHYGGYSCDMDALGDLASSRDLRIVEDAAHSPGARWRGRSIGSIGDATCFSFFSNKNLVTGEGGMVTTNDEETAATIRTTRSHGMTTLSYERHKGHAFTYDVVRLGYNYRLTEIESVMGLVQLKKLDGNNASRRAIVQAYRERLRRLEGVTVPFEGRDEDSACHLCVVLLPDGTDRQRVQSAMKERGIQTSIHYRPVHHFTNFKDRFSADVPKVDRVADRLLTLPLHPLMTTDDVGVVCGALEESLK